MLQYFGTLLKVSGKGKIPLTTSVIAPVDNSDQPLNTHQNVSRVVAIACAIICRRMRSCILTWVSNCLFWNNHTFGETCCRSVSKMCLRTSISCCTCFCDSTILLAAALAASLMICVLPIFATYLNVPKQLMQA